MMLGFRTRSPRVIEPAPLTAQVKVTPARVTPDGQKAMVTVWLGLKKTIRRRAGVDRQDLHRRCREGRRVVERRKPGSGSAAAG